MGDSLGWFALETLGVSCIHAGDGGYAVHMDDGRVIPLDLRDGTSVDGILAAIRVALGRS